MLFNNVRAQASANTESLAIAGEEGFLSSMPFDRRLLAPLWYTMASHRQLHRSQLSKHPSLDCMEAMTLASMRLFHLLTQQ